MLFNFSYLEGKCRFDSYFPLQIQILFRKIWRWTYLRCGHMSENWPVDDAKWKSNAPFPKESRGMTSQLKRLQRNLTLRILNYSVFVEKKLFAITDLWNLSSQLNFLNLLLPQGNIIHNYTLTELNCCEARKTYQKVCVIVVILIILNHRT